MSYCVHCGVELGKGVKECPLCHTPVIDPAEPDQVGEPFFPTRQEKIKPVNKKGLALLLTAMFASVAICCGLLNLALRPDRLWSLYAVGGAVMLWIWLVPPLIWRKMNLLLKTFVNTGAVALYVLLIALASDGLDWYLRLALPILISITVLSLAVCAILRERKHSLLTSAVVVLLAVGLLCGSIEMFVDRFLFGSWTPGWSLIVMTVCVGLCVPLIVVRCSSSLREEARRRLHT